MNVNVMNVTGSPLFLGASEFTRCRHPLYLIDGNGKPLSGVLRGPDALGAALVEHPEAQGVAVAAARHYGGVGWYAIDVPALSRRHAAHLASVFAGVPHVETPGGVVLVPHLVERDRPDWIAPDAVPPEAGRSPFLELPEGALVALPPSKDAGGGVYRWRAFGIDAGREVRPNLARIDALKLAQRGAIGRDRDSTLTDDYRNPYRVVLAP